MANARAEFRSGLLPVRLTHTSRAPTTSKSTRTKYGKRGNGRSLPNMNGRTSAANVHVPATILVGSKQTNAALAAIGSGNVPSKDVPGPRGLDQRRAISIDAHTAATASVVINHP